MSQGAQITELREMLGESIAEDSDETESLFLDSQLAAWIDSTSNLNAAAVKGWRTKMANYAGLVNVTDGAASREFSDLMGNAEVMVKMYTKLAQGPAAGRTRVGKIVRS